MLKPDKVWLGLLAFAIVLRYPFLFMASSGWEPDSMLFHDEGAFLYQGREVLQGYFPYERIWDNRAPFGWFIFSFIYALTAPHLWAVRIFTAILVTVTGYITYRIGRQYNKAHGYIAGYMYVFLASTLPAGQSLSYDHVFALFLSLLLLKLLTFNDSRYALLKVAILFALCCQILINSIILGPAIVLILAIQKTGWPIKAIKPFLYEVARYGISLLGAVIASFALLWFIYDINGLSHLLYTSLVELPIIISGNTISGGFVHSILFSALKYLDNYYNDIITSRFWIFAGFQIAALILIIYKFRLSAYSKYIYAELLLLLSFGTLAIVLRGPGIPYYHLQILPIICLVIAALQYLHVPQKMRIWVILLCMVGCVHLAQPIIKYYFPGVFAVSEKRKDRHQGQNERFVISDLINSSNTTSEYIFVCENETELYYMTNKRTPSGFIMSPHLNDRLVNAMSAKLPNEWKDKFTPWKNIKNVKPAFIVDSFKNNCKDISDFLSRHYRKKYFVGKNIVYEYTPEVFNR